MNAIKNKNLIVLKRTQIRDFIYIDDFIEAIIKILKKKKQGEILILAQVNQ
jgi:dTDP-D-glucose 4,6-dehydratase